ncbi:hypothetical protein PAP_07435 [Palaeococcus pacificus DY20341]|uniref:Uncharacterized protein n=1 Tax=Palaeococcus pacificus DY20341 TaxID=1343739 RepID=A0A075LV59_9EURY|nr:hypothetical protein [Palaeococcus pacificus]AIF69877.1 hypothetical protein PAP_07435 [Palaeococcus pacificus DY20341]
MSTLLDIPPIVLSFISSILFFALAITSQRTQRFKELVALVSYILSVGVWWIHGYPHIFVVMLVPLLTYIEEKQKSHEFQKYYLKKSTAPWVILAVIGMFSAPLLCLAGIALEKNYGVCFMSAGILIFASEIIFRFVKNRKAKVPNNDKQYLTETKSDN